MSSIPHCILFIIVYMVVGVRYKPVGRGFDSRWCHWNFSVTQFFRSHYGPGVDSASNRNEYQVYFLAVKGSRCVRLTTLPPSCAVVMKSGNHKIPGTLWVTPGL